MSGWIDIRERKPTAVDADKEWQKGRIFVVYGDDSTMSADWDWEGVYVAWMPIPKFTPLPDPPEGWRYFQDGETHDKRAKVWDCDLVQFRERNYPHMPCTPGGVYVVPIEPPAPTYRPFANAAEFDPFALKLWRLVSDPQDTRRSPASYSDCDHCGQSWQHSFDKKVFTDGTPFGVKVEQ